MDKKQGQIKSKKRVAEHGEVFTNEREVKAMCDLVAQECDRIDSRFLEPACGNGNFLAEILTRKLATVKKLYKSSPYDYERYSVLAVTSVYGVDILADNVTECRERLFELWNKEYKGVCKKAVLQETRDAVKYILSKNILCGNALTLMCVDESRKDLDLPTRLWYNESRQNEKAGSFRRGGYYAGNGSTEYEKTGAPVRRQRPDPPRAIFYR